MPKPTSGKKSDQKPSKKRLPAKQEKPLKDVKIKHAPPVSSKDIIAKAEANVRVAKPPKSKPAPKPVVKKPVSESSSSEDSESESDSNPTKSAIRKTKINGKPSPSKKISPAKIPTPAKNQKSRRASSGDSSSDSSSEGEAPARPAPAFKANGTSKPAESESSSEEESSEEDTSDSSTASAKPSTAQKTIPHDDSHDSEDDSSEDEKPKVRQIQAVPKPANSPHEESNSSSEDSDSDTPPKPPTATLKKVQRVKGSSSDSDASSDEESSSSGSEDAEMEDHTPAVVTTGKRKAEGDHTLPAKKAKTTNESSVVAKPEGGLTKTIFVGNLSWAVDNDRLSQEFADCGEVISARVQLDRNTGKSRGFGYVTFATTEAVDAAVALNGTKEIDGRTLNLDKSADVGPNREKRAQAFGDVRNAPSKILFVGNLNWSTVEDTLWDAFSEYGEVSSVRLPTDRETGKPKGYGYIEFSILDSAQKAMDTMNGRELDGRPIRLDFSQPRDANSTGRGRGGRGRGGFDGGRGRGGFDGGRGRGTGRGRGGDRGRGRGGARGGMRTGAIAASEGKKITF